MNNKMEQEKSTTYPYIDITTMDTDMQLRVNRLLPDLMSDGGIQILLYGVGAKILYGSIPVLAPTYLVVQAVPLHQLESYGITYDFYYWDECGRIVPLADPWRQTCFDTLDPTSIFQEHLGLLKI